MVFNGNEKNLWREKLYEGGRYWLGAGYSFIQFPRMQMTYVWSPSYKKDRGFTDDAERVTVNSNSMTVRSQDGLKITLDISLHYKAGVSFGDQTKLLKEYADMYTRFGDPITSWNKIINKVSIAAVNAAC